MKVAEIVEEALKPLKLRKMDKWSDYKPKHAQEIECKIEGITVTNAVLFIDPSSQTVYILQSIKEGAPCAQRKDFNKKYGTAHSYGWYAGQVDGGIDIDVTEVKLGEVLEPNLLKKGSEIINLYTGKTSVVSRMFDNMNVVIFEDPTGRLCGMESVDDYGEIYIDLKKHQSSMNRFNKQEFYNEDLVSKMIYRGTRKKKGKLGVAGEQFVHNGVEFNFINADGGVPPRLNNEPRFRAQPQAAQVNMNNANNDPFAWLNGELLANMEAQVNDFVNEINRADAAIQPQRR